LDRDAEVLATANFKKNPNLYPVAVESIYSCSLNLAKQVSLIYPVDILRNIEINVSPQTLKNTTAWQERIKGFLGEADQADISLTQFDDLLADWQPLGSEQNSGYLIDDERIKMIFGKLYSDALYLRFDLLFNRWSVIDKAENYVYSLLQKDENHPLVLWMLAKIYSSRGNRQSMINTCDQLIDHPKAPLKLLASAFSLVNDAHYQLSTSPLIASKLDGRPESYVKMGKMLQTLWNYDMAEKFYSLALTKDPYAYKVYKDLAVVVKNHFQQPLPNFLSASRFWKSALITIPLKMSPFTWKKRSYIMIMPSKLFHHMHLFMTRKPMH
jgi:tetratricopeptide (TPR) repeat protein